jgi:hypothetical protein
LFCATNKAAQTISFGNFAIQIYGNAPVVLNPDSDAGLEITYTSDNENVATISGNTLTLHQAGTAQITATQAGNAIYDSATPVIRTLIVEKAPLTITADDKNRVFGEANPVFTLSYNGFKNSETKSVLDQLPDVSCAATVDSPAGFYDITLSGGSDTNYNYQFINGRLEVTPLTGINAVSAQDVSVYPNPVKHDLFIRSDVSIDRIEIYHSSGARVLMVDSATEKVDVSALEDGFYFVRISIANKVITKKIVVRK